MCGTAENASKSGCVTASISGHRKATIGFMQDTDTLLADEAWKKETEQCWGPVLWSPHKMMKTKLAVVCEGEEWTLSPGHMQPLILHQRSALVPHR